MLYLHEVNRILLFYYMAQRFLILNSNPGGSKNNDLKFVSYCEKVLNDKICWHTNKNVAYPLS